MNEIEAILADLERQRRDLEEEIESRRSAGDDITALRDRLTRLRQRIEKSSAPARLPAK